MDFTNVTDLPADMMLGSTGEREMICIVASKATLRIEEHGLVLVRGDERWSVFDKPFEFRGVSLAPDLDFRKRGTDLLIFGSAVAPGGEPVDRMWVSLASGDLRYRLAVYGDRFWTRVGRSLVPSEPQPFRELSLGNERAFGGESLVDGTEVPHPVNPDGRGFYLSEEEAEGAPLPNLERPDALISEWTDHPTPACLLPPVGSLESATGQSEDDDPMEAFMSSIETSFNQAVPELVTDPASLGDSLRLDGFSSEGKTTFPMPPRRGPEALASVGDLRSRFPSFLSTLVVLVPERVYVATYLSLFRYLFRPREKRSVELRPRTDRGAGVLAP